MKKGGKTRGFQWKAKQGMKIGRKPIVRKGKKMNVGEPEKAVTGKKGESGEVRGLGLSKANINPNGRRQDLEKGGRVFGERMVIGGKKKSAGKKKKKKKFEVSKEGRAHVGRWKEREPSNGFLRCD